MPKGFTLIELLVVITIIGILASVVLVNFPGATARALDARIIIAISQMRTIMIYYQANNNESFNGFTCDAACSCNPPEMNMLCQDILDNTGTLKIFVYQDFGTNTSKACIYSPLNSLDFYCTDSTGHAGTIVNPVPTCGGGSNNGTCGF